MPEAIACCRQPSRISRTKVVVKVARAWRAAYTICMKAGDQVGWQWGKGIATGEVLEVRSERTQVESKGKLISRNGTSDDPAVIIRSDNGSTVLKLAHEIQIVKGGEDV